MTTRPNILFLMCDQLQGRVFDSGSPCFTPNLDRFAADGVRFQKAYTPNAVCSPARASLMTGLLPHNHGVLHVTHTVDNDQSCLRTEYPHWAQRLQQAGYRTGYFGKWHVERTAHMELFGWQVNGESSGPLYKNKRDELQDVANHKKGGYVLAKYNEGPDGYGRSLLYGVTDIRPEQRGMGVSVSLAADFLDEALSGSDPWCCFVSITEPHDPFVCGKQAFELYDVDALELQPNAFDDLEGRPGLYKKAGRVWKGLTDRERKEAMACYYASVSEIDAMYGTLIQKLRDCGQYENTIIVFTSDHGELLGAKGLYTKNISAGEEVYHIPLIMAGQGIPKGLVIDARVGLHELCPTLLELTGCEPIQSADSRSFTSLLQDPQLAADFQSGFAEYHGGRTLLTQRVLWDGNWKYVYNGFDIDELYDLKQDPYELNNLAENPEFDAELRRLCSKMWNKIRETGDHSVLNSHYPSLRLASYGPEI